MAYNSTDYLKALEDIHCGQQLSVNIQNGSLFYRLHGIMYEKSDSPGKMKSNPKQIYTWYFSFNILGLQCWVNI